MRTERLRTVSIVLPALLALALLVGAPGASACQFPDLVLTPPGGSGAPVHPGDPVGFSASNVDPPTGGQPGGTFTVHVAGHDFSVTNQGPNPGVQGSFQMPDLGDSSKTVYVTGTTSHEGDTWQTNKTVTLNYEPATPPSGPPPGGGGPGPGGGHGGRGHSGTQNQQGTNGVSNLGGTTSSGTSSSAQANATSSSAASSSAGDAVPATGSSGSGPEQGGASLPVSTSAVARAHQELQRSDAAAAGARHRSKAPEGLRRQLPPRSDSTSVVPGEVAIPGYAVLGLAALIVVAGGTALALRAMRRGGGAAGADGSAGHPWLPPPVQLEMDLRGRLIEAELQEMIAEERARQLLTREPAEPTHRSSGERTPASNTA
jgi:hypothetical protein